MPRTKKLTGKAREQKSVKLFKCLVDYGNLGAKVGNGFFNAFNTLVSKMTSGKTSVHPAYNFKVDSSEYVTRFFFTLETPGKRKVRLRVVTRQDDPSASGIGVGHAGGNCTQFPFTEPGMLALLTKLKLREK